jgi:predicted Zn-dependent protease
LELSYSKELESEADDYSIDQMSKRNIDLNGFVDLFEIIQHEHGSAEPPTILNTHPATKDRILKGQNAKKAQKNVIKDKTMQDAYNQIIGFETRVDNLDTENETQ